jgi:serine/threonine protein kinase
VDEGPVVVSSGYQVGPWRVSGLLATGSWSSVYAAEAADGRVAALKVVPTGTLTQRQLAHLAALTGREIRAHERLDHPSLIRLLGVHVLDDPASPELDGATVLVMERANGSAAAALTATGGAGLAGAPRIIAEVCAGLAYLHGAGWVHGDVKPGNILLMADGSARLADFGLTTELTGTHGYLPPGGSTDYLPPERWTEELCDTGVAVRQTADVWALGVTAYQLLTGHLPFPGVTPRARATAAAAYAAGRARLSWPADLPEPWRAFIADCLLPTHDLRRRHGAADLARRAEQLAAAVPRRRGPVSWRGHGVRAALAGVAVIAAVAAAGTAVALSGERPVPRTDSPYARYFRTDAGIPPRYYDLIVRSGTGCPESPAVRPLVVAALLKAESDFQPDLADPAKDEYGIARWTPKVLQYYLPAGQRLTVPAPPFPPEVSIPAVGRFLCRFAPELETVPGDPMVNLAATYRTSASRVRQARGVPDTPFLHEYMPRFTAALTAYRPVTAPQPAPS